MVAPLAVLALAAACVATRAAKPSAPTGRASLTGVWDPVSVSTRWPDGRVTEPWGATPVVRITYGADGRKVALLMDARRNQADGRAVQAELEGSAASYYGTYVVDAPQHVVTHHVVASLRGSEAGTIERRYRVIVDTLVLTAEAMYEGKKVTHTLVWHRAARSER